MTLPPSSSRAGSIRSTATSTASTSTPVQRSATSSSLRRQPQHANTISHKLRHLFDSSPTATFLAAVTVHELTNVPQVSGDFAIRWKFRGSRPLDADKMLQHPTPRVTGREALQARANARGTGTPTSQPPLPARMAADAASIRSSVHSSTSGSNLANRTIRHAASLPLPRSREHKFSDPPGTPEKRRSVVVEEPQDFGNATPMTPATPDTATDPERTSPASSREHSMYSDGSHGSGTPGASGAGGLKIRTTSIADSGRGRESRASMRSDVSTEASASTSHASPTASTGAASALSGARGAVYSLTTAHYDSKDRKGTIPPAPVRAHAVAWEYAIQHVLRLPLGKAVPTADVSLSRLPASQKTNPRKMLPILGHGPMSDSSLRLEVLQVHNGEREGTVLGHVNVDLAPFADQGPTARRYLLMNSRTNATLRISVDMRCIGGDTQWITPPFAEGHLTDLTDLTGREEEYAELQLMPTRSISSTASDSSRASKASRPSFRSTRSNISLNQQQVNQVTQMTKHRYHSYEYHLRPEHRRHHHHHHHHHHHGHDDEQGQGQGTQRAATVPIDSRATTLDASTSDDAPLSPVLSKNQIVASPLQTPALPPTLSPVTSKSGEYFSLSPTLSPVTPRSPSSPSSPHTSHARYDSTVSALDSLGLSMSRHSPAGFIRATSPIMEYESMQPDLVIESCFNPAPAAELGPFTYTQDSESEAFYPAPASSQSSGDQQASTWEEHHGQAPAYDEDGNPIEPTAVEQPPDSDADGETKAHARWRRIKARIHHHQLECGSEQSSQRG
ncbi:hypothetical protein A1Q2_01078 [Trichosporon asahii var. asahii CBS 8904]|uniref:C2 NT-type domain-containing protein n=1 Tax=Trichosporon asahii var. asahii (strain CBS 8904) TaxID=1220162 RepID=K1W6T8_TRIAC|nr:hypothetical protein A1Q2_01078 [Trichosporon asahii var. asahii CBS 8904]